MENGCVSCVISGPPCITCCVISGPPCTLPNINKVLFYPKFQGPSLLVYNDAVFTESDLEGIRSIYQSCKVGDPLKVGRFGLGFKSVFHMTDCPSLVSNGSVMFLDPHEEMDNFDNKVKCRVAQKKCFPFVVQTCFSTVESAYNDHLCAGPICSV